MKKSLYMLTFFMALKGPLVFAAGGEISGGGDDVGLQIKKVVRYVSEAAQGMPQIYPSEELTKMMTVINSQPTIIVVEHELPVTTTNGSTQSGVALSSTDGKSAIIQIQRERWQKILSPLEMESIIHHEICILAGVEVTGDYHLSDHYRAIRKNFWEKRLSERMLCSITLFEKATTPSTGQSVPGKILGVTSAFSNSSSNTNGGWGVLTREKKRSGHAYQGIILRYVFGGYGYFRGIFSRATIEDSPLPFFTETTDLSSELIFYDPYSFLESSKESLLKQFDFGFVLVGCSRY